MESKIENNVNEEKKSTEKINPIISILAFTYDAKVGQLILSGTAYGGIQINAGFSGKETSSTKILNNKWSLTIPGKLISGKQKVSAVLLGRDGKILRFKRGDGVGESNTQLCISTLSNGKGFTHWS